MLLSALFNNQSTNNCCCARSEAVIPSGVTAFIERFHDVYDSLIRHSFYKILSMNKMSYLINYVKKIFLKYLITERATEMTLMLSCILCLALSFDRRNLIQLMTTPARPWSRVIVGRYIERSIELRQKKFAGNVVWRNRQRDCCATSRRTGAVVGNVSTRRCTADLSILCCNASNHGNT